MTHLYMDNFVQIEQANGVTRITLLQPIEIPHSGSQSQIASEASDIFRWAVLDCFNI